MSWTCNDPSVVLAIHDQQIAEHGDANAVRAMGLLESARAWPARLEAYGERDAPNQPQPMRMG